MVVYNEQFGLMADPYMFLATGGNLETATTRPVAPNTGTMNFLLLHSFTIYHDDYHSLQVGVVPTHTSYPLPPPIPPSNPPSNSLFHSPSPPTLSPYTLTSHPLYHHNYHDLQVGVVPTVLIPAVEEGGLWVD